MITRSRFASTTRPSASAAERESGGIRSEKSQPHKARRIRSRNPFLVRDGLERRTVRPEHSLGDFLTTHEQSDQDRIHWRRIVDALDDELHLLAGSLQARANAEPNQSLFGGHCHGALG